MMKLLKHMNSLALYIYIASSGCIEINTLISPQLFVDADVATNYSYAY